MQWRRLEEVSEDCGVPYETIKSFIQQEWVSPKRALDLLDEEDIARINLIWELKSEFGVNDEAVPIILNLLDQLYRMHLELKKYQTL